MKQIFIRRTGNLVAFDEVNIDVTENVFFTNLDTQQSHWPGIDPQAEFPDFCDDPLDPAPSDNSSQCPVPPLDPPNTQFRYRCRISGHDNEEGIINVVP